MKFKFYFVFRDNKISRCLFGSNSSNFCNGCSDGNNESGSTSNNSNGSSPVLNGFPITLKPSLTSWKSF